MTPRPGSRLPTVRRSIASDPAQPAASRCRCKHDDSLLGRACEPCPGRGRVARDVPRRVPVRVVRDARGSGAGVGGTDRVARHDGPASRAAGAVVPAGGRSRRAVGGHDRAGRRVVRRHRAAVPGGRPGGRRAGLSVLARGHHRDRLETSSRPRPVGRVRADHLCRRRYRPGVAGGHGPVLRRRFHAGHERGVDLARAGARWAAGAGGAARLPPS